jgi:hypothetical protein
MKLKKANSPPPYRLTSLEEGVLSANLIEKTMTIERPGSIYTVNLKQFFILTFK